GGDLTVRSRVVDQGVRSVADSRVNSAAGKDSAKMTGGVAVAVGIYDHNSSAVIGDGAIISADHIGVGARTELPIDNDYDELVAEFNPGEWEGIGDFFSTLGTVYSTVTSPDAQSLESFGLPDYLL